MKVLWNFDRIVPTIYFQLRSLMASNDPALRGTAATPELWAGVYMMLVFALLSRSLHALARLEGKSIGWQEGAEIAIELIFCPAPLLMGLAFRKLIRRELY